MTKRNLLFVSPRFLFPTDSGGKIRTTQILRGLKGGAFRTTVAMPATMSERDKYAEQIQETCDIAALWEPGRTGKTLGKIAKALSLFSSEPIPVRSDRDAIGAQLVKEAIECDPDVVVFDFPHSTVLAPDSISVPSVMFTHNIEAEIFLRHWQVARLPPLRWLWRNQYNKMRRFEKTGLSRFDSVIAVSDRDCQFFRSEYGVRSCRSIPTGVDTDYFQYARPHNDRLIVFCGSMDWMANVDGVEFFFDQVWPLVTRQMPDARMKVVGRAPPPGLVERIRTTSQQWEFTGFVDDVREHICGAGAFVIPLRVGGGTRIKAFEAMSMGTPVVSTSIGIEGLPVVDGQHYLNADEPSDFANMVVELLDNSSKRLEISKSARALVCENFGFRKASSVFEEICLETRKGSSQVFNRA